jgi:hypothetical protein
VALLDVFKEWKYLFYHSTRPIPDSDISRQFTIFSLI